MEEEKKPHRSQNVNFYLKAYDIAENRTRLRFPNLESKEAKDFFMSELVTELRKFL